MTEFFDAYRQFQFLYGPEVMAQLKAVQHSLERYLTARVAALHVADAEPGQRFAIIAAPGEAFMSIMAAQEQLGAIVRPYLDLTQVAVIPTERGRRWAVLGGSAGRYLAVRGRALREVFAALRGPSGPI